MNLDLFFQAQTIFFFKLVNVVALKYVGLKADVSNVCSFTEQFYSDGGRMLETRQLLN